MNPFTRYDIVPDYAGGFTHTWEVSGALADALPWTFTVEQAPAPDGPWEPLGVVTNAYTWTEPKGRRINKNPVLYFRVGLATAAGAKHTSTVRMPYGDLGRREFLIARDIMRREVLHMRTLAGTLGQVYLVSTFGPKCKVCIDPISGGVRNTACKTCLGTGRNPPYRGPYEVWLSFSPAQRTTQMAGDGTGTREPVTFSVRMIGAPLLKKNDVVVDPGSGKRYYVDVVQSAAEIRRVPVIQNLTVNEAPVSDPVYKLTP